MTDYDPNAGATGATGATGSAWKAPVVKEPVKADAVEFTDLHRAAATRAHARGLVAVIDRGPAEPKAGKPAGEQTPAEIEAEKTRAILAKRERDEWRRDHPEPVILEMSRIDAQHATTADPDRYLMIPWTLRAPATLDERVARIEQRLGPETNEEIKKRAERDAKFAADRDAKAKAAADKQAAEAKTK